MRTLDDLAAYCLAKKGASADYPFDATTLVFRVGGKIFALTSTENSPARVNLKCEPTLAADLRDQYSSILPGYHMNKLHWNTVVLDGTVPDTLIREMIDMSYDIVFSSLAKKMRLEIAGK